jgi:hypothetical protein
MTKVNAPKQLTSMRRRNQPMDQETRTVAALERRTDSPLLGRNVPTIANQGGLLSRRNGDQRR